MKRPDSLLDDEGQYVVCENFELWHKRVANYPHRPWRERFLREYPARSDCMKLWRDPADPAPRNKVGTPEYHSFPYMLLNCEPPRRFKTTQPNRKEMQ